MDTDWTGEEELPTGLKRPAAGAGRPRAKRSEVREFLLRRVSRGRDARNGWFVTVLVLELTGRGRRFVGVFNDPCCYGCPDYVAAGRRDHSLRKLLGPGFARAEFLLERSSGWVRVVRRDAGTQVELTGEF